MATNTAIDFRVIEALGTVFLSTIEEELVSLTYGATRLIKQGIAVQYSVLNSLSFPVGGPALETSTLDVLIAKLADVIEELQQRNLAVAQLEMRVARVEESLTERLGSELPSKSTKVMSTQSRSIPAQSTSTIEVSEVRLHAIEDSLSSVELLAGGLGQQDENLLKMNQRLSQLESLLSTLSHLPDLMGQQHQILSGMDSRLSHLEAQQVVDREVSAQGIEPDRVF